MEGMTMAKEKEPENIEAIIAGLYGSASEDHKKNIELFEKYHSRGNQAKVQRHIKAAFEGHQGKKIKGALNRAEERIDTEYKEGQKIDLKKDVEKFHRIGVSYILGYFEHAKPAVISSLKETDPEVKRYLEGPLEQLDKDQLKRLYETLAHHFDREVAAGQNIGNTQIPGMSELEEEIRETFKDEGEVTADMLKELIEQKVERHKLGASAVLATHARNAYIAHLPSGLYAAHVLNKVKKGRKTEIKPEDAAKFTTQSVDTIAGDLHIPLVTRRYDDLKLQKHGFYMKEDKK
ncbi:hypothetical protein HYU12_01370 [Candidatus Woesearchaeota archaeon]|nr:hypothetical protein [Candidatus Woesearchaeota archaeon]